MAHCAQGYARVKKAAMSTPQDSPRRKKQKARRSKQLAEWREKKAGTTPTPEAPARAKTKKS